MQVITTFIVMMIAIALVLAAQTQMSRNAVVHESSINELESFRLEYILRGVIRQPIKRTVETQTLYRLHSQPSIADYIVFAQEDIDKDFLQEQFEKQLRQVFTNMTTEEINALLHTKHSRKIGYELRVKKEESFSYLFATEEFSCAQKTVRGERDQQQTTSIELPGESSNIQVELLVCTGK